jgi:hypothetical protein
MKTVETHLLCFPPRRIAQARHASSDKGARVPFFDCICYMLCKIADRLAGGTLLSSNHFVGQGRRPLSSAPIDKSGKADRLNSMSTAVGARVNLLLEAVPEAERRRLAPFLETVSLDLKDVMVEPGEPIRYVYFPSGCVASSVYTMRDGSTVETAITGFEGLVGVHVWLRQSVAVTRTFVQVPGECMRMRADVFLAEVVEAQSPLNDLIAEYVSAYLSMTAITSACNRIHRIEERLCRWLKMVHNRVEGDVFPVRHEFLAYMLGVHRPSVSIAAAILRRAGLIRYEYGRLTVLDAKGLESGACECYSAMEMEFERRFGERLRK